MGGGSVENPVLIIIIFFLYIFFFAIPFGPTRGAVKQLYKCQKIFDKNEFFTSRKVKSRCSNVR